MDSECYTGGSKLCFARIRDLTVTFSERMCSSDNLTTKTRSVNNASHVYSLADISQYWRAVEQASLIPDLQVLPDGDLTEVS